MAPSSLTVAVIGAGVAGLCTARELKREGHKVIIYEKANQIGGTWLYDPHVETDPIGLDPNRKIVHSSLYRSLCTNLPIQLMGFSDYPFRISKNNKLRNFTGHEDVLKFLNGFAVDFGLVDLIKFNKEVLRVEMVSLEDDRWIVESRSDDRSILEEIFDAVVVCNGHYTKPRIAQLPGIKEWPGKQIHSHNYRVPEPFQNQIVVVIGNGPSAHDISQEITKVAKEVHLSSRSPQIKASKLEIFANLWQHSKIEYCHENGEVRFKDGAFVVADVILHCTGYNYEFPFLETNGIVTVDDNRIEPLYKHVFPPQLAPSLSFVGIPSGATMNFPTLELQAKWVARILSGKVVLPSKEEMLAAVEEHYRLMEQSGVQKHHTHTLPMNFEYVDWVAAQVGEPPVDEHLKEIFGIVLNTIRISWIGGRERIDRLIS